MATKLLMHFDEAQASDTPIESAQGLTVVKNGGARSIVTGKFGNGISYGAGSNGDLNVGAPTDFALQSDWTIEWWSNTYAANNSGINGVVARLGGGNVGWYVSQRLIGGEQNPSLFLGSGLNLTYFPTGLSNLVDQWVHWAVVRYGTDLYMYRGVSGTGSRVLNETGVSSLPNPAGVPLMVGVADEYAWDFPFQGKLDELRISDTALYTGATYQVPSGPFGTPPTGLFLPAGGAFTAGVQSSVSMDLATVSGLVSGDSYYQDTSRWQEVIFFYQQGNQPMMIRFHAQDGFAAKMAAFNSKARLGSWPLKEIIITDFQGGSTTLVGNQIPAGSDITLS